MYEGDAGKEIGSLKVEINNKTKIKRNSTNSCKRGKRRGQDTYQLSDPRSLLSPVLSSQLQISH
jgi:hypothetical protein